MSEPEAASVAIQEANNSNERASHNDPVDLNNAETYSLFLRKKKRRVLKWSRDKQLVKLGPFSRCQIPECICTRWKRGLLRNHRRKKPAAALAGRCGECAHTLGNHVSHIKGLSVEKMNILLGYTVDVTFIIISLHLEKEPDIQCAWFSLLREIRKCIMDQREPNIEGTYGTPPFELPTINTAVANFVTYKYSTLEQDEWQKKYDIGTLFLNLFNKLNFETLTARQARVKDQDKISYKLIYSRWLFYCYLPKFHDCLKRHHPSFIFGRKMMEIVFEYIREQITAKCMSDLENETLSPRTKDLILNHFSTFMDLLAEEIHKEDSPIWDPEFKQTPPAHFLPQIDNEFQRISLS